MAQLDINNRGKIIIKKLHADEETPRKRLKRLTSLLKMAVDRMGGICAGREFHNWAVVCRACMTDKVYITVLY